MKDVEKSLGATGTPEEFRRTIIARVAGWGIDHPGEAVPYTRLFPQHVQRLREAFFQDRRKQVVAITRELVTLLSGEEFGSLDADGRRRAEATLASLRERFGYCAHCARDAAAALLKERFADAKA